MLVPADAEAINRIPQDAKHEDEIVLYCPNCDKPYWQGSHVRRMRRQLENFSQGIWNASVEDNVISPTNGNK